MHLNYVIMNRGTALPSVLVIMFATGSVHSSERLSWVAMSKSVFVIVDFFRYFGIHIVIVSIVSVTQSIALDKIALFRYNYNTLVHSRTNAVSVDMLALACNYSSSTMSPSLHVCAH